jgi:hypothetical protein
LGKKNMVELEKYCGKPPGKHKKAILQGYRV